MTGRLGATVAAMVASVTPKSAERRPFSEADFREWLPKGHTMVAITEDRGRSYALFVEFNIAGTGATEEEALADASQLLTAYLQYSFMEGRSFAAARKPVPVYVRLKLRIAALTSMVLRGISPHFARVRQFALDALLGNRQAPHPTS